MVKNTANFCEKCRNHGKITAKNHGPLYHYIIYSSVFQPFCCSGTINKREGHSQNPMHWSMCPKPP